MRRISEWLSITLLSLVMLVNAWLVDDAYITFRTVVNAVNGHGLVWNIGERVQVYTHPLWMFLITGLYAVTSELFFSVIVFSWVVSLGAFFVARQVVARHWWSPALLAVALLASKAVLDYTSSGLENPLSYLLMAWFLWRLLPLTPHTTLTERQLGELFLVASLSCFNRSDTILLYVPALLWALWLARHQPWPRIIGVVAVATLPVSGWVLFSLIYYGYPLPNTAYAKALSTDVALWWKLQKGWQYHWNSIRWDTASHLMLVAALYWSITRKHVSAVVGLAGGLLYLFFVFISGATATHMSGRFLAVPLFMGVVVFVRHVNGARQALAIALALSAFLLWSPVSAVKFGTPAYIGFDNRESPYIDTKWFVYNEGAALLNWRPGLEMPNHAWYQWGLNERTSPQRVYIGATQAVVPIGYACFAAGPDKFFIDVVGLSDPLLSRLPAQTTASLPGHFPRPIPDGYVASIEANRNLIVDPFTHTLYDAVRVITRDPLWSWSRMRTIVAMNVGAYELYRTMYVEQSVAQGRVNNLLAYRAR